MGWTAGVRFPAGATDFSLLHTVQTRSGADLLYYPMGTGTLPPGVKWPKREADHSSLSSAEVKNNGAIPPLPHTSLQRGA
jgi:hypothetical protein